MDGLPVTMTTEDGVPLYQWAKVTPKISSMGMSISAEIDLATPAGLEPFAKIAFTAFNNNMYAGTLKMANGNSVAKFARMGGGTCYTTAAGVDVGLLVAAHVASVKNICDSDQRG